MRIDKNQSMIRNFAVKISQKTNATKIKWRKGGGAPVVDPPSLRHAADNFDRKIKKTTTTIWLFDSLIKIAL